MVSSLSFTANTNHSALRSAPGRCLINTAGNGDMLKRKSAELFEHLCNVENAVSVAPAGDLFLYFSISYPGQIKGGCFWGNVDVQAKDCKSSFFSSVTSSETYRSSRTQGKNANQGTGPMEPFSYQTSILMKYI